MSNKFEMLSLSPCFCTDFEDSSLLSKGFQLTFLLTIVFWNCYTMFFVYKHRGRIPLRQRAPMVSIMHIFCSMMIMLLQLILEFLIRTDSLNWENADSCHTVPWSRRLFKFVHVFFRIGMTILAFLRYCESIDTGCCLYMSSGRRSNTRRVPLSGRTTWLGLGLHNSKDLECSWL